MKLIRLLCAAAALIAAFQLAGCAAPPTFHAMTVKPGTTAPVNPALRAAVRVGEVHGAQESNPRWVSQVDNAAFEDALEDSLFVSGYLVRGLRGPRYEVAADLVSMEQSLSGLGYEVKSAVNYRLTGAGLDKTLAVTATGAAGLSDSWGPIEGLRMASERALQQNIRVFIDLLATLKN